MIPRVGVAAMPSARGVVCGIGYSKGRVVAVLSDERPHRVSVNLRHLLLLLLLLDVLLRAAPSVCEVAERVRKLLAKASESGASHA